jgi:hypothetical protein
MDVKIKTTIVWGIFVHISLLCYFTRYFILWSQLLAIVIWLSVFVIRKYSWTRRWCQNIKYMVPSALFVGTMFMNCTWNWNAFVKWSTAYIWPDSADESDNEAAGEEYEAKASRKKEIKRQEREARRQVFFLYYTLELVDFFIGNIINY